MRILYLMGLILMPIMAAYCQNLPEITFGMYHSYYSGGIGQRESGSGYSNRYQSWNPGLYAEIGLSPEYSIQNYTGFHRYGFDYSEDILWRDVNLTQRLSYISNTLQVRYAIGKFGLTGGFQLMFLRKAEILFDEQEKFNNRNEFYKFRGFPSVGADWAIHPRLGVYTRIQGGWGGVSKGLTSLKNREAPVDLGYRSLEIGLRVALYKVPLQPIYRDPKGKE